MGIVVEVTHHDHSDIGVGAPERIGNCFGELGRSHAVRLRLFLSAKTRRPVVDNHCDTLSEKRSDHAHLIAGTERNGTQTVVGDVLKLEIPWIIEQSDIDTSGVRAVVVHYLKIPFFESRLIDNIFHHRAVLNLGYSYNRRTDRSGLGCEMRYSIGEVSHFFPILSGIPLPGAFRSKLKVAPFGIIRNSVE